MKNKRINLFF